MNRQNLDREYKRRDRNNYVKKKRKTFVRQRKDIY